MAVSLPPPTPSLPDLGAPKLRSSCDDCGTAKVKCDRGRPGCGRCANIGVACVYGPSRKFGKPPRKRPASSLPTTVKKRIRTLRVTQSHENSPVVAFEQLQGAGKPAEPDILARGVPAADIIPFSCDFDAELVVNNPAQLPSELFPALPFDQWFQLDSFGTDPETCLGSAAEPTTASPGNRQSHSCRRESYNVFRDLICPSPSLHAPESHHVTVSAHLDLVLHMNRNATEQLSRILKCPCAKTGHRAMVHASIVSRILIWYQQAAGWTGSSSWGPRPSISTDASASQSVSPSSSLPPSSGSDDSPTDSPSLVQATGFAVEHVPISIGTFSIEDQNVQAAFRNQLVLSELKKTANLIDIFSSLESSEFSASGVAGLYSYLGVWLRGEHSRTVKILKSRLDALSENIIS